MRKFYLFKNRYARAFSLIYEKEQYIIERQGASDTQTLWQDNQRIWTYNGRTNFINIKQIYNKKFFTFANIYAHILFK